MASKERSHRVGRGAEFTKLENISMFYLKKAYIGDPPCARPTAKCCLWRTGGTEAEQGPGRHIPSRPTLHGSGAGVSTEHLNTHLSPGGFPHPAPQPPCLKQETAFFSGLTYAARLQLSPLFWQQASSATSGFPRVHFT